MITTRTRRVLPAAGALLAALLTAAPAAARPPAQGDESGAAPRTGTGRVVVGDGHVDIGPRFDDGTWTVQVRDDTVEPPTWRHPRDVVLHVGDAARAEVPPGEEFSFLGEPGGRVWPLPQETGIEARSHMGIGAAGAVAAVAATLVWRRGRGPRAGGGAR
ncbi:choice-of-anchor M domain-containing protein [Streptomyces sp. MAR4 CNX-425]|uniref:choice-of-anchor M domain-containing protein n=1 Tax=Streptomyces sp. MAR4 CNX-425 TaxID=3406343 RepID=UPI003B5150BD